MQIQLVLGEEEVFLFSSRMAARVYLSMVRYLVWYGNSFGFFFRGWIRECCRRVTQDGPEYIVRQMHGFLETQDPSKIVARTLPVVPFLFRCQVAVVD